MKNLLQEYQRLKANLSAERERIQQRIAALNAVLEPQLAPGEAQLPSRSLDRVSADYLEKAQTGKSNRYEPRKGSLPAKILAILAQEGTAMRIKDIAAAVKTSGTMASQACLMLLRKRRIKREGHGHYSSAN